MSCQFRVEPAALKTDMTCNETLYENSSIAVIIQRVTLNLATLLEEYKFIQLYNMRMPPWSL